MESSDDQKMTVNGDEDMYNSSTTNQHEQSNYKQEQSAYADSDQSLYGVLSSLLMAIFFPDPHSDSSFFQRTKDSCRENLPHLREASKATGVNVLRWARQGSSLRLLLVISIGTITLLTLTGVLVFLLFLAAATVNAIIISLFMSLAAAGGFLAIFFACVAGIYIGALSIAVFVISSATISAIITVLIVTGWLGFFWIVWSVVKKSAGLAKHSVSITGSALTAYTSGWHAHQRHHHHD
ncbi:uncharacterized protein LOC130798312 [Amaranthus tricolor]|uniref:uncharacterized protein LOC130798312 n=1 Tax=Amaranthus tricolor TaxID=29722 RepID=UPI0025898963|nr:uncharacterized protein LOC130798312 [Amaranthus tricolor]